MKKQVKCVGILTAGGDCPGLNAAIRGVAKSAMHHGIKVVGIQDGFRGLVENRFIDLAGPKVSGILTLGGTILGSSRDKPHKMKMGNKTLDMTDVAIANAEKLHLDTLVCLGGNGTQKNALKLSEAGIPVITLPKTIDNDVYGTDITFGFDTALNIATDAIDRLHTTATSHHRIIVCEIMGHSAGWLTLGAGVAGGADVILIPEIPYDLEKVAEHIQSRRHSGKRFSIVAVAEGIKSKAEFQLEQEEQARRIDSGEKKKKKKSVETPIQHNADGHALMREPIANRIARKLNELTGIDARVTSLGHVQRGGSPSATDRLLCSRLGTHVGKLLCEKRFNEMVAIRGEKTQAVPLTEVAGKKKLVPVDHQIITTAKMLETCFGD